MGETENKPDPRSKNYDIVVNGTQAVVHHASVTYEQVVEIAFPGHSDPNLTYSVTYHNADGPHGGTGILVADESVKVMKEGTSFDVYPTTRS